MYWGYNIKTAHHSWTKNAVKLALSGGIITFGALLYAAARLASYRSHHLPVLSLRKDGLWYQQKFVCAWHDISRVVPTSYSGILLLGVHGRSSNLLANIMLDDLHCNYDDLIDAFNGFIDASKHIQE